MACSRSQGTIPFRSDGLSSLVFYGLSSGGFLPPPRSPPLRLRSRGFPRLKDGEKLRDFRKSLQGTVPYDRLYLK
jgi:hypothetical protein